MTKASKSSAKRSPAAGQQKAAKQWDKLHAATPRAAGLAVAAPTISRNEIYHRVEWFLDRNHNPNGPHTMNPATPIEAFIGGADPITGRLVLWNSMNKMASQYVPGWNSALFHGVLLPWESTPGVVVGFWDMKVLRDLLMSYAAGYRHAGWRVV